jgi:hypothetical protein
MDRRAKFAFLLLVLTQACHSVEECAFRLFDRLPPARFVAARIGLDPAIGFAIANSGLVAFGLWCWAVPVRRGWPSARAITWGWAAVEAMNCCAHVALAIGAGGYFPGLATAPLLLAAAAFLGWSLTRRTEPERAAGKL